MSVNLKNAAPSQSGFISKPFDAAGATTEAKRLLDVSAGLPAGIQLLVAEPPLTAPIGSLAPDRLLSKLSPARLHLAAAVVDFLALVREEARPGALLLEDLMGELERLPAFSSFREAQYTILKDLASKGLRITDLPLSAAALQEFLVKVSQENGVALEYVFGNLDKVLRLIDKTGIRASVVNVSALFHNFHSGFLELDLSQAEPIAGAALRQRAEALRKSGIEIQLFNKGHFTRSAADLEAAALNELCAETDLTYALADGQFSAFAGVCLALEEKRLAAAPAVTLQQLLTTPKFKAADRERVALSVVSPGEDPRQWASTLVGRALSALHENLNWVTVSAGIKAAGEWETLEKDEVLLGLAGEILAAGAEFDISLASGRNGKNETVRAVDLKTPALLFDLYCLAVLEKRTLRDVLNAGTAMLQLLRNLDNHDPVVRIDALITGRLAGETHASLLGSQGLILQNSPLIVALEALRSVSGKADITVPGSRNEALPLAAVSVRDFRTAVVAMGQRWNRTPDQVLSAINDKIVPEIRWLPKEVIAKGPHDLGRIVELSLAGVPTRYPLRRPWHKVNLDYLVNMGSGLQPGIRNCMGCPVNSLYGLVTKTAVAQGFDELITYEATGCFEVYSGIWPYTGKKNPSVHGVFGGAPSELLGGLAAKRARVRYALKHKQAVSPNKVLHLGWGGDGATFDIGFGNLSGLFSRLQRLGPDDLEPSKIYQRGLYVCYDNEGYQNTGNQYSAASAPGGNTTTNPQGKDRPFGNDLRKKPIVEIIAEHGVPIAARMNIHRQEHISRVVARALEDGDRGSFIHFLQPCTTGWKFTGDSLTYDLAALSEDGGLFTPVTIEYGVPYLEHYPTPRSVGDSFLKMQARFKHLLAAGPLAKGYIQRVIDYYQSEWKRNLKLTGFDGEIPQADRLRYLDEEHRIPRTM